MLSCSKSGYYDWVNLGRPKYKAFNESYNQLVLDTYTKIILGVYEVLE